MAAVVVAPIMSGGWTGNARREFEFLTQVEGPLKAEAILIAHSRRDTGSCLCGWTKWGKSHAGHQVEMLREAGLLVAEPESPEVGAGVPLPGS